MRKFRLSLSALSLRAPVGLFGALLLPAAVLLPAATSHAVGTRHFVIETGSDFESGELEGVAVDSTGFLRAGFDLGSIEMPDAETVWASLEVDGGLLLATGNEGKLFELKAGKVREVLSVKDALAVTSLEKAFGKILVGAMPGGKLYEFAGDKLKEFTELKGAEHIWDMAFDEKSKTLYVATGPEGKLYRVTADGTAQVYYDAPQSHLVSVAARDGKVFAGSSGEARLYEVTGPGRARVLQDFSKTEVRGIAISQSGDVFSIANELTGGPRDEKISTTKPMTPRRPSAQGGKGVLYRFDKERRPEELYASKSEHFVSLELDSEGRPVIGTGSEGKVIRVEEIHNHAILADVEERQVISILRPEKGGWIVANDPVVLHPIEAVGGQDAVFTSDVLDAGLRATFGRINWDATGKVEFSTRSGNTSEPDETWSDFSASLKKGATVASPAGRYLQVRVRLSDGEKSQVRRIDVPFVTDNLRPVITSVKATSGADTKGSGGISSSGGPISGKSSSKIKLNWEVENPDEDELRYRVEYRRTQDQKWFDALSPGEVLTNKSWDWETEDLPEGEYFVRVDASDEPSNSPGRVLRHQLSSGVILVDNTAPQIAELRVQGRKLSGKASDGIGPVRRIELRAAGQTEWIPIDPKDGVFDQPSEAFEFELGGVVPAEGALVTVRVFDTAGNFHVEHVRVPAGG
jgi:hypothetical protein